MSKSSSTPPGGTPKNPARAGAQPASASQPQTQPQQQQNTGKQPQTPAAQTPAAQAATQGVTRESVAWPLEADRLAVKDALLECLQIVSGLYGRRISTTALAAGLPIPREGVTPALFIRAAERADLSARLAEKSLDAIAIMPNLPCILALEGNQACIVSEILPPRGKQSVGDRNAGAHPDTIFRIILPETPDEMRELPLRLLAKAYTGNCFFLRPVARLDDRAGPAEIEEGRDWFWSAIRENKSIYIEVGLAAIVINIFAAISPLFVMNVYDRVVPNGAFPTLWVLAIGMGFAYIFDLALKNLRSFFIDVAGRRADVKVSGRIFEQVMGMKLTERPASAGVLTAHMREFDSLRDFFTSATMTALIDMPFSIIFLILVTILGGWVVLPVLAAIPIVIGLSWFKSRHIEGVIRQSMAENALKNALLFESVTGLETVKVQAAEGHLQRQWEELTNRASRTSVKMRKITSSIMYWASFIQSIASIGVIIVGVYMIAAGHMTTGALVASYMLSNRALAPLSQIAGLIVRMKQTRESLQQLENLMLKKVERPRGRHFISMPTVRGKIELRDVVFGYPNQTVAALANVSLTINPGDHIGIIGAVGSGKTTLQRLVQNLYEPVSGAVLLDGTDVRQIDPGDLRRAIGVIQQRPQLFYGSVRQNITMGHETVSDRAVIRAAELSGVMDFLRDTQHGLDTQVGERGEALSGGQQQAVAVARALLYDPPILIMDEPTSSLDPASEMRLMRRLEVLVRARTVVLITHKATMLTLVDKLILMDRGRILAMGPKDEILRRLQAGEFGGSNTAQGQDR
ncbi:MAG: type I secretion system permease/ATPase [Rhodospirillales bacterium]|nr:type I secretion system permease/ATPase [Alphaproteobacteria bacterium]MCB9986735.1 type I secretion system permease/ATPase [Rhodospirillales bacterium]USO08496.1 MAG: type I secretion system permease/ATPase [Rhodospirillales bacterium]